MWNKSFKIKSYKGEREAFLTLITITNIQCVSIQIWTCVQCFQNWQIRSCAPKSTLTGWFRWWRIHLQLRRPGFNPWVRKTPCRREWQSTPVFLPRESHGHRSLTSYSPWGCKELDTTEQLTQHIFPTSLKYSPHHYKRKKISYMRNWKCYPLPLKLLIVFHCSLDKIKIPNMISEAVYDLPLPALSSFVLFPSFFLPFAHNI